MADFSFLNVRPGGGPEVDDDEATNTENQAFEASHAEAAKNPVRFNLDTEKPAGVEDFQQKRTKAADFAKKQTLGSLDQLASLHDAKMRSGQASPLMGTIDYEGTKQRIFGTSPENYAEELYKEVQNHQNWLGQSDVENIMRPSEEAVTSYKQLQAQNAVPVQQIEKGMQPADVHNAQLQLASLNNVIEQTKQKLALAATSRQSSELQRHLDFYDSQKRVLEAKIPPEQAPGKELQGGVNTVDHAWNAAGLPRQQGIQALTEMRRMVELSGIDISAPVSPLSFIPTYTNLISHIFNPQVRDRMLGEMGPPPEPPQGEQPTNQPTKGGREPQKSTFGSDMLEQDPRFIRNQMMINQRESRHQQIMTELANSHTFKNIGDVLGFVLTSFLLGPKVASLFFSNMLHNGNLRQELDLLNHETTNLYHQQNSYIQLAQHARAMAASDEHNKATEAENARHHWAMEGYMKSKQLDTNKLSAEDKQIHQALQQSMRSHFADVQAQSRKVKMMNDIIKTGDPRDPDYKWLIGVDQNTKKSNITAERQKLFQMEQEYASWRDKTVSPWYRKRGIELIDPNKGTPLNEKTFDAPTE